MDAVGIDSLVEPLVDTGGTADAFLSLAGRNEGRLVSGLWDLRACQAAPSVTRNVGCVLVCVSAALNSEVKLS